MAQTGFWDDNEKAQKLMKEMNSLKSSIKDYEDLKNKYQDVETLIEIAYEENEESLISEIDEMLEEFIEDFEDYKLRILLSERYDKYNAILTLHAGAGGTESCDWASMLSRMYQRWAEKRGFNVEILDYLDGDEAGYKSITLQINGDYAYGYLKSEKGVHRLVRISPFNAAGKRQTSFVSCDVMPDIDEDIDIEINEEDLRIDTYRSSGAGSAC